MAIASTEILGQYEASLKNTAGIDRVATDKDTFLKLLVAQLTHQDPLNPVEDKEFIAQLAQFTSVEELQKINTGIEGLNSAYAQQQVMNATSFLGMQVSAKGDLVTISDIGSTDETKPAYSSFIYANYPSATANGTLNVYATNADGTIGKLVYSETMGANAAGTQRYQWHGKDAKGNNMANGTYVVSITAKDAEGNSVLVSTSSIGKVIGVETATDGNHKLYLEDGRTVNFNNVEMVTDPTLLDDGTTDTTDTNTNV